MNKNALPQPLKHKRRKLLWMCFAMFLFGFALIPFYQAICELTGINILSRKEQKELKNTQIDTSRTIDVEFDANTHAGFTFTPEVSHLKVHPGALTTVNYRVQNTHNKTISAQAIPSYAPAQAAQYFAKLECFCFKQQNFAAAQTRIMPVVFVIQPKLPKDIKTITLSYTFFEVNGAQKK